MIECKMSGKNDSYIAFGQYDGKQMKVLAGSKIKQSLNPNFKINKLVLQIRQDTSVVTEEYRVIKDVYFPSASTAAQFVTGNSTNGLRQWKEIKSGKSLGELSR